jgi:hypothetical protein
MLPAKLCRHRDTNHLEYKNKDIGFFKRKLGALTNCRSLIVKSSKTDNVSATETSYRVNYRTALTEKAHTISVNLIKPCAIEMPAYVLGEQSKEELETVQLSVAFKICQQIYKKNWCRDLNVALLFRCNQASAPPPPPIKEKIILRK